MGLLNEIDVDDIPQRSAVAGIESDSGIWCFTLKYDETDVPVVILNDGSAPCIDAVELYTPGEPLQRAAVLAADGKDCPFTNLWETTRNKSLKPKKFYVFSVLDLRGFTRSSGEKVEYSRKALLVKGNLMDRHLRKKLKKVKERQGTLRGSLWEVSRGPQMNPSPPACGDDWNFSEMIELGAYGESAEILSEEEILSLFVTDPDELVKLAKKWEASLQPEAPQESPEY